MGTRRRGYRGGTASLCICVCRTSRSACLFDPEFTPALRAYLAVDERAGVQQRRGGRHHIPT